MVKNTAVILREMFEWARDTYGCSLARIQTTDNTPAGHVELEFVVPDREVVVCYLVEDYEWQDRPKEIIDFVKETFADQINNNT